MSLVRSCVGVWDTMLGSLRFSLANSSLGAIITHAVLAEDGLHLAAAESGDLLYWSLEARSVVYSEKRPGIRQLGLLRGGDKVMVSCVSSSTMTASVSIKMFPEGDTLVTVEYPYKRFVPAVLIQVIIDTSKIYFLTILHRMRVTLFAVVWTRARFTCLCLMQRMGS